MAPGEPPVKQLVPHVRPELLRDVDQRIRPQEQPERLRRVAGGPVAARKIQIGECRRRSVAYNLGKIEPVLSLVGASHRDAAGSVKESSKESALALAEVARVFLKQNRENGSGQ